MPADKNQKYPVVMLKMNDTVEKECPFVTDRGCSVYADRPWSCRMYPVGSASPGDESGESPFYFIMREDICRGFAEQKEWTIREWLSDQEIDAYDETGELFKEIALHDFFAQGKTLTPKKIQMFFMVCYNIDAFRRFLFESSFFERFDVGEETRTAIENDDVALLKFGFRWLKFALFGEPAMTIKKTE